MNDNPSACADRPTPTAAAPITVSLVLGSGGARGLAHIGVIQWLTENGYQIRAISGASIGALVGGIYAARKLEVYAEWVLALERMHVLRLLDPTFGRPGLFKGERIISVLRELIGDCAIEDLPIAYTAVATDMHSREEVWLREGQMFDAIRASIATPLVFTPFRHGRRTLLDGALVNPVPIGPTLEAGNDLTVIVDLSGPAQPQPTAATSEALPGSNRYKQRIGRFIDSLQRPRGGPPRPQREESVPRAVVVDCHLDIVLLDLLLDQRQRLGRRRADDDAHPRGFGVVKGLIYLALFLHADHSAAVEGQACFIDFRHDRLDLGWRTVHRQVKALETDVFQADF
ncbi:MAG: patatin-like phospholipase family protein, partial [Roseateles sp.]